MKILYSLLLLAFTLGCSKPTTPADSSSSEAFNAISQELYPHSSEWKTQGAHKSFVRTHGYGLCTLCHANVSGSAAAGSQGFCTRCHSAYPHAEGWKSSSGHGAEVLNRGSASCTNCHGTDLQGGTSSISCKQCHDAYPHSQPQWTASGPASAHAAHFIAEVQAGNDRACQDCHGAQFDRILGGKSCLTCHPRGITHRGAWTAAAGHGLQFSSSYTSINNNNCNKCHGSGVNFRDDTTLFVTKASQVKQMNCVNCHINSGGWPVAFPRPATTSNQTATSLASSSTCYTCHSAYPHTGYDLPFSSGTKSTAWGPNGIPLDSTANGEKGWFYGHVFYMRRHPLFQNSQQSCGGNSPGSCHSNARTGPVGITSGSASHGGSLNGFSFPDNQCSVMCHR